MTHLEQAILDLVSVGMRGDALSVRQLARRVMRTPHMDGEASPLHGALERLLAEPVHPVSFGTLPGQAPGMEMLRVETVSAAKRPVLAQEVQHQLDQIVAERAAREELFRAGLEPSRTVLLIGAPGVGKTMTARYVAHVLGLPLLTIDLARVVSRYLGQTGQNLRQALDVARATPCVLLLDEFDAIGKRRDDASDIGELKRIVNVLLLELEDWSSEGLLLAATNHPELLDRAVWRRFDRVFELALPGREAREAILSGAIAQTGLECDRRAVQLVAQASEGCSGSDLVRQVRNAARDLILAGRRDLDRMLAEHTVALLGEAPLCREAEEALCLLATEYGRMSHRTAAERLGRSQATVQRRVKGARTRSSQPDRQARAARSKSGSRED